MVLAKTITNANGDSFKFFHFPGAVTQKERRQRWKGSCHSGMQRTAMCTRINKNKNDGDLSIPLPRPF